MQKNSLPSALKSIRLRMGESMRTFAERLGVTNPTISGYESGKIRPSRSMLLLIHPLAETPAEKASIEEVLGGAPSDLAPRPTDPNAALNAVARNLVANEKDILASGPLWDHLVRLLKEVSSRPEVPLWLAESLHLWCLYRDVPGAREKFDQAFFALGYELELVKPRSTRAAELQREAEIQEVATIIHGRELAAQMMEFRAAQGKGPTDRGLKVIQMFCSSSKKWFDTGFTGPDLASVKMIPPGTSVLCPHCHMSHPLDNGKFRLQ